MPLELGLRNRMNLRQSLLLFSCETRLHRLKFTTGNKSENALWVASAILRIFAGCTGG
jgi:hypothetical protein